MRILQISRFLLVAVMGAFLTACMATNSAGQLNPYQDTSPTDSSIYGNGAATGYAKPYSEEEVKKFLARTGGRTFCGKDTRDSDSLIMNLDRNAHPDPKCLYAIPQQNAIPLTVVQATREGILASVKWTWVDRVLYLANDNTAENNLVDGANVQSGYFIYTGVHRYQSLTGERSVYAFKRIDDPFRGLQFYDGRPVTPSDMSSVQMPSASHKKKISAQELAACTLQAGKIYEVPPAVLIGIMDAEGGRAGQEIETDFGGNHLLGAMRINSRVTPELAKIWKVDIDTAYKWVRDDGCVNVHVAAWILRQKINAAGSPSRQP